MKNSSPFNSALVRARVNKTAASRSGHDFLSGIMVKNIINRLGDITRSFETGLYTGNTLSREHEKELRETAGNKNLVKFSPAINTLTDMAGNRICGDYEKLPFQPESFDMIISTLGLHNVNDLPGTLIQMKRSLKPDGLFLAALPGGDTLHELRQVLMQTELKLKNGAVPRVHPFATKQQMGGLLQRAGFALPVVDSDTITVSYRDIFHLINDIRGMGESNSLSDSPHTYAGKHLFSEANELYQHTYKDADDRISATFEIIYLIGWAPHKNQQQPLRPGSAETRLANALDTDECFTGIKTMPDR